MAEYPIVCPKGYVGVHTKNDSKFLHGNLNNATKYSRGVARDLCDARADCHGLLKHDDDKYILRKNTHLSKGPARPGTITVLPQEGNNTYSFCIKEDLVKGIKL